MRITTFSHSLFTATLATTVLFATTLIGDEPVKRLTVHEWGTFTVLQDEKGRALPGVNINEEALPPFVHRLSSGLVPDAHRFSPVLGSKQYGEQRFMSKGIARVDPVVTMRMETPIVYFHLPDGTDKQSGVDVKVGFQDGWISEWFPNAKVHAPGFDDPRDQSIRLGQKGTIQWKNLTIRSSNSESDGIEIPQTDSNVWLAPRNVDCDTVCTAEGPDEKYLFYRGVANIGAPLTVVRSEAGDELSIKSSANKFVKDIGDQTIHSLHLVHITDDNRVAFREFNDVKLSAANRGETLKTRAEFSDEEYSADNMDRLHDSMRSALMQEGLYEDEANAFLATWQLSYFRSPGLRLFFTLPNDWTERVLPLEVSKASDISRAMIGRIELVTPEQRELLNKMKSGSISNRNWFNDAIKEMSPQERRTVVAEIQNGTRTLETLGVEIPDDYRAFMQLGRFRDALVLDEAKRSKPLRQFANNYGLSYARAGNLR